MLREDIDKFLATIPNDVCVVAATKYVDAAQMRNLYNSGVTNFGENRVDAFLTKYNELADLNIKWHFIGHLQRNKAKDVINKIDCLHSLDSLELAKIINEKRKTPLDCFIEVSINLEESKNGVAYTEIEAFLNEAIKFKNINIVGFMMMSVKYSNHNELLNQFKKLYLLRNEMEEKLNIKLPYLSMGMSDDYQEAIENHATHIRLGRILWKI